jgi:acetolactate synthase-1/2/3 large subunit
VRIVTAQRSYPTPWHAVTDWLAHHNLPVVFGLPGDDLGLLRALEPTDIRMILCRDQRNAMFMTIGYALESGRFGVCVVGKGPALTNTMTGLLEARSGGAPLVLIAGGTGADRRGSGALQELDQLSLVRPLVTWAERIDHPARLVATLDKAACVASGAAPGVVYVEIPDHLLAQQVTRTRPWAQPPVLVPSAGALDAGVDFLVAGRRPILLVGGGLRGRNADRILERFAERIGAAVFTTASGRGVFDERHPAFCGLAGLYTPRPARNLWRAADLVVAAGSRLEETATYRPGFVDTDVPVVQINIEAAGLSPEFTGPKLIGDAMQVIAGWLGRLRDAALGDGAEADRDPEWPTMIGDARAAVAAAAEARLASAAAAGRLTVAQVLADLDHTVATSRILVQENGLQDMWSYFYPCWTCGPHSGSIVPSEQTSLGFGASAAGGAALAAPERVVIALVGDGAFTMVANDLLTMARERVPVLYVVLRNGGYGWLQRQLDEHGTDTRFRFVHPDQILPAPAHDAIHHTVVSAAPELHPAIENALTVCRKGDVAVLEIAVQLDDVADEIAELSDESAPEPSF